MKNLCMAGGVALNCVANGRLIREGPFENLWVQPAAGDAGGALGAALFVHNCVLNKPRSFRMDHAYWGPAFSDEAIRKYLDARGAPYETLSRDEMIRETARLLHEEQAVVGWFQGRMEWGPRSLGSRSILADARNEENWKRVNLKIKFRESFRPFAPACLEEKAQEWFDIDRESPYMLLVCQVKEGKAIPAGDPRRRLRPAPDGHPRASTPEFYDLLARLRRADRLPGADQHLVQRPGRAHRVHARTMRTSASCGPTWTCWCSATRSCARRISPSCTRTSTGASSTRWTEPRAGSGRDEIRENEMAARPAVGWAIFSELWSFMKVRKKWWLGPIIVTMLLLSALIVFTQGSAVAPFIYALF